METKIREVLEKNGYSNVVLDYQDENQYFFEGESDAFQQIRVDVSDDNNQISIYDRYIEEKHYAHFGNFTIEN